MSYTVKEIFYTLQGEGLNSGRPAVFCRFSDCNLWSGLEEDRDKSVCSFCDTDFVGTNGINGGDYERPEDLCAIIDRLFPKNRLSVIQPFVVFTGGEPLLQLDESMVKALHRSNFQVAVETNGTIKPPRGIDWITVSPKIGSTVKVTSGDELKLIFPQAGLNPEAYEGLKFRYFYLQPKDGPDRDKNTELALNYCLEHPVWRLSLQKHKYLGIP